MTAAGYKAAIEYIRLSDLVRLFEHIHRDPSLAMVEHLNQARAKLDEVLPSSRAWRRWTPRQTHRLSVAPSQKMDALGLSYASCSCGYTSAAATETEAYKAGGQHVAAMEAAR